MLQWFYQETDRGEENISDCKSLYELVEKLQYRIEDLENEYMQMMCEMQKIYKLIGRENLNED